MFPNGDRFEGRFEKSVRAGYGKVGFTTGESFEGNFENDDMHGRGVWIKPRGAGYDEKRVGIWDQARINASTHTCTLTLAHSPTPHLHVYTHHSHAHAATWCNGIPHVARCARRSCPRRVIIVNPSVAGLVAVSWAFRGRSADGPTD